MSRRKPLHRYPEEYFQLFEAAQLDDVVLDFATPNKAKVLRVELYNLRAQVREALIADTSLNELAEHLVLMDNVQIRLRGSQLVIGKKPLPPATDIIRTALNDRTPVPGSD